MTFAKALFHNPQLNQGIYNAHSATIETGPQFARI